MNFNFCLPKFWVIALFLINSWFLSGAYLKTYTSYGYEIMWVNRSHQGGVQCTWTLTLGCFIFELLPFVYFHTWILSGAYLQDYTSYGYEISWMVITWGKTICSSCFKWSVGLIFFSNNKFLDWSKLKVLILLTTKYRVAAMMKFISLTLYQMTTFQIGPNWKYLQMTKCNLKAEILFGMGRKHRGKRKKCWLPAFSPFSHNVFKRLLFQGR